MHASGVLCHHRNCRRVVTYAVCGAESCTSAELRAPNNMINEQKLRKANKELRDKVAEVKAKLEKVSQELTDKIEEYKPDMSMSSNGGETLLSDKADSVEFVSAKYDVLTAFNVSATKELKEIRSRGAGMGCRDGAVVRALTSHQCGPGSIPRLGVICGLSLLVLYSAPRFSPGTPVSPLLKNQNLI